MPISVSIPDLPDEVHAKLAERAAAQGVALPEYLRSVLITETQRLTIQELAAEIAARPKVVLSEPSEVTIRRLRDALE